MGAIQRSIGTDEAVVRAIGAGADLAVLSHQPELQLGALDALTRAVRDGRIPMDRLEEAAGRLERLRARKHGPAPWPDEGLALARQLAGSAVTLVRDAEGYLPLRASSVGIVSFAAAATGVEEGEAKTKLGAVARGHIDRVVEVDAREGLDGVCEQVDGVETVIVGTARTSQDERQAAVVRALLTRGLRVVIIALRDPFDLLAFPHAPCFVAAYGDGEIEMEAVLRVLCGLAEPRGRLPVALPGLYARGHGLLSFTA